MDIQTDVEKIQADIHSLILEYDLTCSFYNQQAMRQQQVSQVGTGKSPTLID
jgi:hypothetical protein